MSDGGRAGRRVVVTGIGLVSPLGDDPAAFETALAEGRDGAREIRLFPVDGARVREAGEVDLAAERHLPGGNLRPLDRTGQLAAAAAALALADAGLGAEAREGRELGLALGTMYGSVHTISAFDRRVLEAGPAYAKPLDFANTVINAAAGQTAIWHRLKGLSATVAGGLVAGHGALAYAVEAIRGGRAELLLAGGAEELAFESFFAFHQAGLLAGTNGAPARPIPFDAGRNGFRIAEGAALLVLEAEEAARARGARILAELAGHASGFDPGRGRAADKAAGTVERTARAALADAGRDPAEIDAVSASAHGGRTLDLHEGRGLAAVFGGRPVATTAIKAMVGEALGASGALQAAAAVLALGRGRLPGIRGLERLDETVPLGGASPETRELALRSVLVSGLGLDGAATALVVERWEGGS